MSIVSLLEKTPVSDAGGVKALKGFEFQSHNAIYILFKNIESKKHIQLFYELHDDFQIVDVSENKLILFQVKGLSQNVVKSIIINENNTNKSVIKKMYETRNSFIENMGDDRFEIENVYLFCKKFEISRQWIDKDNDINPHYLNLKHINEKSKEEIKRFLGCSQFDFDKFHFYAALNKEESEKDLIYFITNVLTDMNANKNAKMIALSIDKRLMENKGTYKFIDSKVIYQSILELKDTIVFPEFNEIESIIPEKYTTSRDKLRIKRNYDIYKNTVFTENLNENLAFEELINILENDDRLEIIDLISLKNSVKSGDFLDITEYIAVSLLAIVECEKH